MFPSSVSSAAVCDLTHWLSCQLFIQIAHHFSTFPHNLGVGKQIFTIILPFVTVMVLWKNYKNWQSLHHPLHLHYITICYTILPLPPPPPPPTSDRTLELSPQTLFTFSRSPHFACINIYMEESVISGSKLMASFCAFIHWHRNIYHTPSVTILRHSSHVLLKMSINV